VNWQTGAAIAEIVAAVAVIASLIYLAIQIRQNNALLRSGSRQALVTNDVASLAANFQNADVFARYVGDSKRTTPQARVSDRYRSLRTLRRRSADHR
jgi:hypothetical protein